MTEIAKVDVELDKVHNHAGIDHPKGAVIQVPENTAAWLEQKQIGRRVGGKIVRPRASGTTAGTTATEEVR